MEPGTLSAFWRGWGLSYKHKSVGATRSGGHPLGSSGGGGSAGNGHPSDGQQHQRSSEAVTGHLQQLRREEECRVTPVGVHRSQQQPQEAVSAYGRRLREAFEVVQARERDIGVTITS